MKIAFNHMQRSGGHAVIEFIISNINGSVAFYNNCTEYSGIAAQTLYYGKPPYSNVIYSFKNLSCDNFNDIECCQKKFVILRSFENFLASVWAFNGLNDMLTRPEMITGWVDHAKFCTKNPEKSVLFDVFVQSVDYRKHLCERLGIPYKTSKSLRQPAMFGSTFGDIEGVLWRYKQMLKDKEYAKYLTRHNNAVILSKSIFNAYDQS